MTAGGAAAISGVSIKTIISGSWLTGQRIEAYLVARGAPPDAEEISQFLRRERHLAGFKVPKAFHWIDEMPTGPTGKLFRRALRNER